MRYNDVKPLTNVHKRWMTTTQAGLKSIRFLTTKMGSNAKFREAAYDQYETLGYS